MNFDFAILRADCIEISVTIPVISRIWGGIMVIILMINWISQTTDISK